MKLHYGVTALLAAALAAPVLAQDKTAPAPEKAEAKAVQQESKAKSHSHLQDRQGIVAAQSTVAQAQPAKKPAHNHAKFHKQQ